MLFISETGKGWRPIPYTRPHSQGSARGTSTITGTQRNWQEGGWQKQVATVLAEEQAPAPPSVVQGPPHPRPGDMPAFHHHGDSLCS